MSEHSYAFPREVESGIMLINKGEYFRAHEILELAWKNEKGTQRPLYQGLVQVSVLLYHLHRGNKSGGVKLLQKALANLAPFQNSTTILDIKRLVSDLENLSSRVERIHPSSVNHLVLGFRLYPRKKRPG